MTCNVSLYSESLTINCESVRTIYLSNKIDEEIDTKIVQYNDLILKFWFNSLRAKQNHSKKIMTSSAEQTIFFRNLACRKSFMKII